MTDAQDKVKLEQVEVHLRQASTLLLEVFESRDGWGSKRNVGEDRAIGNIQSARSNVARALSNLNML